MTENSYNTQPNPLDFQSIDNSLVEDVPQKEEIRRISLKAWFKGGMIAFVIIFALILYFKPKTITEPLKYYLNGEYGSEVINYDQIEDSDLWDNLTQQGELELSEGEFAFLLNKNGQLQFDRVESEENKLTLFVNLSKDGNPLWLGMQIELVNDQLEFTKVGFGRLPLPEWIVQNILQRSFGNIINQGEDGLTGQLIGNMVQDSLTILMNNKSIRLEEDKIFIVLSDNESFFESLDLEDKMDDFLRDVEQFDFNNIKDWVGNINSEN